MYKITSKVLFPFIKIKICKACACQTENGMRYVARIILTLVFVYTMCIQAQALYKYSWKPTRVIDGDTVEFQTPFLPKPLKPVLSVRVYGVDTPEHHGKCMEEQIQAEVAKSFTEQKVFSARIVEVELKKWDKYAGRVLAEIWLDNKPLSLMLLDKNLARSYHGEKKQGWCTTVRAGK